MSDLSLTPDFVYDEGISFKTLISPFENGYEQRRAKWANPIRKFGLVYKNRPWSQITTLRDLFITKEGSATSFTFTNINDSVEYTVRFADDSFKPRYVSYGLYDLDISLLEVK